MRRDASLDALLDLNGQVIGGLANGHWVKFEASRVTATPERPHGIRYSLTLHNAAGQRVFGIDNAHAIGVQHGIRMIRPQAFDHLHLTRGTRDQRIATRTLRPSSGISGRGWTRY